LLGSPSLFIASVSIGADGKIYIATENTFQCANPDLTPVFTENISYINTSGCALGPKNTLAISGGGTELRVYKSVATAAEELEVDHSREVTIYPNPVKDFLIIQTTEKIKKIECLNYLRQATKCQHAK
jgi:hypothetical protein